MITKRKYGWGYLLPQSPPHHIVKQLQTEIVRIVKMENVKKTPGGHVDRRERHLKRRIR